MNPNYWSIHIFLILGWVAFPAVGQERTPPLDREFQAAVAQYNAGEFAAAAAKLENLVRDVPQSFEAQELLGLVYSAQSRDAEANEHLDRAVSLRPDSAEARTSLAANQVRLGKFNPALKQFEKAVELAPQNFDTNHNLGELYVRVGQLPKAIQYLEHAQRIDPSSYDNGYDLSLAYILTGKFSDGRQLIHDLLKRKDAGELHNLLGELEEKDGQFVAAENEFEAAAHKEPSESNLFDWGSELLLHRTLGPAVDVFQKASGLYPASSRLMIGLGVALYSRGNYDEAVAALLKGADLNPSDARCYLFLSKAYDSSPSQAEEVTRRFRRFAELDPGNAKALYYYAMSLWKGKRAEDPDVDFHQIESLLKKSITIDPTFAEAHLQMGNLDSAQNKYKEAIPEYVRAHELNPDLADAYYRLGQAYVRTGQKELAQEQFHVYQGIRERHLADLDKQRAEIRQFVYSAKDSPSAKQ
ncbi:MAG TPA: tetratricopeptide repeat protein [Candidatus Acidoferrales bacterium]|nr:tetratricopeptide repeat protein [Candidatus Acidoferrales bacterium]